MASLVLLVGVSDVAVLKVSVAVVFVHPAWLIHDPTEPTFAAALRDGGKVRVLDAFGGTRRRKRRGACAVLEDGRSRRVPKIMLL